MLTLALASTMLLAAEAADRPTVLVVVGAAGEEDYGEQFAAWAERWAAAATQSGAALLRVGPAAPPGGQSDRQQLATLLAAESTASPAPLWLVLIGHGTYDGREAKFNLRGPDISAAELAQWLAPIDRPLAVINCASASGPFINALSRPGRVVVTATRSGSEHNFARFGDFLSGAMVDPAADLDKDEQTSLLEAFLAASRRLEEFYKLDARLATEHPLLDDNGDALGTPAAWFQGTRAVRRARDGAEVDGAAAQRFVLLPSAAERRLSPEFLARRQDLEHAIQRLRQQKASLDEHDYYDRLEPLLVELARLYAAADEPPDGEPPTAARPPAAVP